MSTFRLSVIVPQYTYKPNLSCFIRILFQRQRIVTRRIPNGARNRYKTRHIIAQSRILENVLYRNATTMDRYSDLETLTQRLLKVTTALRKHRHPGLFVYFDTEW